MAKIYGISGAMTGKRGADVFAVTNGIQTFRQYQPIVANPRTAAQLTQRCKMNVAGRLTKLVSKSLLKAMNMANNRKNRSEFNKGLIKAVVVTNPTKDEFLGSLNPADVKFSRGAAYAKASVTTPAAISGNALTIGMTLGDATAAGKYAERIIVVVQNTSATNGAEAVIYRDQYFDDTTAKSISMQLPDGMVSAEQVIVYRVPIDLTEEGMSVATSGNNYADGNITGLLEGTAGLVRDYGETIYYDTLPFTAA